MMKKRYDIDIWLGDEGHVLRDRHVKTYVWVDVNASPEEVDEAVDREVLSSVTYEIVYSGITKETDEE